MKTIFAIVLVLVANYGLAQSAEKGETIFKDNCQSCHSVGGGKLVGPDLKGVSERRNPEWLLKFINSPKKMIDAGDAESVKLFEENNKIMMPDHTFITESDVKDLIAYFESAATAKVEKPKVETKPLVTEKVEVSNDQPSVAGSMSLLVIILLGLISVLLVICLVQLIRTIQLLKK